MIKRYKHQKDNRVFYRINERINALTLRVLDADAKQIGVLSKFEALTKARELGLDLVEVAPKAVPPVARIVDYNKFLYQQEKKKREEKRKSKVSETKEIRLGPFMETHDLAVMIRRGRDFLQDNDKVRLVLKFVGRQVTHPEFGFKVIRHVIDSLSDISKVERDPHLEGKQLIALLVPEKKKSPAKNAEEKKEGAKDEKDKKVSSKTV